MCSVMMPGLTMGQVLLQRGHVVAREGNPTDVIFPLERGGFRKGELDDCRRHMGHRTFRKMLRRLAISRPAALMDELRGEAGNRTQHYLDLLVDVGVCQIEGDQVRLVRPVDNVGPTLEWYVSQLCSSGLAGEVAWGVTLDDVEFGTDFDVLAHLSGVLLYVETKSGHPDEITASELAHFLSRTSQLMPEIAILLVDTDTELPSTGLMVRLEEIAAEATGGRQPREPYLQPTTEFPKIWQGLGRLYVCNTEPKIVTQLRRCVRHYNMVLKHVTYPSGPGPDFRAVAERLSGGS